MITTETQRQKRELTANRTDPIGGVSGSADTFVVAESSVP